MRIRLIKSWKRKQAGTILDPQVGVAQILIRRRIAVEYPQEIQAMATSSDRVAMQAAPRPRGRPRLPRDEHGNIVRG